MSIPLRDIAGLLHKYWKPFNKGEDMRPYLKCHDCIVSQDFCNHDRPPYPHCYKGEDTHTPISIREIEEKVVKYLTHKDKGEDTMKIHEQGNYNFGQIFRLQLETGENDYYILAVTKDDMFVLINLQWGSRMSDAMMFPKKGNGVPWSLIAQHASYFLGKMGADLFPVTDVKMTYNDLPKPSPVISGEGQIGVQR